MSEWLNDVIGNSQALVSTSSISALVLSVYNWFKARVGAKVKLSPSYKFGIFTYQSGRKIFYFPLDVSNNGNRVGKITELRYELTSPDGHITVLTPHRRVETSVATDKLKKEDFKELLPTLPVFCPPAEGMSAIFEFFEENEEEHIIQQEINYQGKVFIEYNGGQDEMSFTLRIPEATWNSSGYSIQWARFQAPIEN